MIPFVLQVLNILSLIVIADALLSWVTPDPNQPPRSLTNAIAEPLGAPIRWVLKPEYTGGIDFSPIAILLLLQYISRAILEANGQIL